MQAEYGSKERETRGVIHTLGHMAFEGMYFVDELSEPRSVKYYRRSGVLKHLRARVTIGGIRVKRKKKFHLLLQR